MECHRRQFLKWSLAAGAAAGSLGVRQAWAQGPGAEPALLTRLKRTGVMRVGTAGNEPGNIITPDGFSGDGLLCAQLLCKDLGIPKIEPVITPFSSIVPALMAGRVDMISSGFSITRARCAQIAFSDPYFAKLTNLVVKKGNPFNLKDFDDVAKNPKVRFGYVLGGTEGPQARAAGVPDARISTFPSSAELFDGLRANRVDVLALPDQQVNWRLSRGGWESKELETPGSFIPKVNGKDDLTCPAFAFRTQDADFRDLFNVALERRKQDGSILAILKRFAVTERDFDLARHLTARQLCQA